MKKIFISLLLLSCFSAPCFSQQSIEFREVRKPLILIRDSGPKVYKPTKLIIGKDNTFTIKADPGSNVLLEISAANSGAPLLYGQTVRLGNEMIKAEGLVPQNGLLELSTKIPNNKNLEGTKLYFEAIVWKNKDYSDAKAARIISPNGSDSDSNSIYLALPVEDPNKPTFMPAMGGSGAMMNAIDAIEKVKNGEEPQLNMPYTYQEPAMLQNLRAHELMNK